MADRPMIAPVRCVCGRIYDSANVEVIARYVDCSVWKAPCCGRQVDDNIFKTRHDFTRISREEAENAQRGGFRVTIDGRVIPESFYGRSY